MPTTILVRKILEMFLLMAVGFWLYRKKLLTDAGAVDVSRILTTLIIPVILINSLWEDRTPERTDALLTAALLSALLMAVAVATAILLFRRDGVATFSAAFPNAAFIGIPLIETLLGREAVVYISPMVAAVGSLQYTLGLALITGDRGRLEPRAVLKSPVVRAVLAGALLYALGLPKPALARDLLTALGGVNTPMAMVLLGAYLARSDLKQLFAVPSSYLVSAVRLVLIPGVSLAALSLLPRGRGDMALALLITAACPAASLGAILARQHGGDYVKATGQVCISTLLSLITLPLFTALCLRLL